MDGQLRGNANFVRNDALTFLSKAKNFYYE